jgi:DNA (cytosine-5)-methyltransferase 1
MQSILNIGTLFSGAGAFEQSLNRLNIKHKILFACDNDKFVKKTYFSNYLIDENKWHDDVRDFNAKKFKYKLDILVGGSPCQSFSIAGKRAGLEDTRGTLFYEFARIVSECRPKMFIFENVKGMLTHDSGNTWRVVLEVFESLGYSFNWKLMNSKDYGIPQNRERVFIVGFRDKKKKYDFPNPIDLNQNLKAFLDDIVDFKYFMSDKGVKFVYNPMRIRKKYTQVNGDIILCQKANQQSNLHGDFVDYNKIKIDNVTFARIHLRSKIVNVKKGKLPQNNQSFIFKFFAKSGLVVRYPNLGKPPTHGLVRRLTPRECFRLMGFPENFKIVVSDQQAYRQSGNSIVVDVLIAILNKVDFKQL